MSKKSKHRVSSLLRARVRHSHCNGLSRLPFVRKGGPFPFFDLQFSLRLAGASHQSNSHFRARQPARLHAQSPEWRTQR